MDGIWETQISKRIPFFSRTPPTQQHQVVDFAVVVVRLNSSNDQGLSKVTPSGGFRMSRDGSLLGSMLGKWITPPKTNMEPKNVGFEDDFPFQRGDFQVPC